MIKYVVKFLSVMNSRHIRSSILNSWYNFSQVTWALVSITLLSDVVRLVSDLAGNKLKINLSPSRCSNNAYCSMFTKTLSHLTKE